MAGSRIRVLIWGRLIPSSAFVNAVVLERLARPIDSVWRFGRDLRHSTNGGMAVVFCVICTLMNLRRARISPKPGIKKGTEVLHTGSHKFVRVQSIRNDIEVEHQGLARIPPGQRDVFPYQWQKSQPHQPARHTQRSQRLPPLTMEIAYPIIRNARA